MSKGDYINHDSDGWPTDQVPGEVPAMNQIFGDRWVALFDALGIPKCIEYRTLPDSALKVLTICRGGTVRSVALAFLLKYKYSCDAIAMSMEKNSSLTRDVLWAWADIVLITEEKFRAMLPAPARFMAITDTEAPQVVHIDLPVDRWANPCDLDLLRTVDAKLRETKLFAL